jgi:hypothetical protein
VVKVSLKGGGMTSRRPRRGTGGLKSRAVAISVAFAAAFVGLSLGLPAASETLPHIREFCRVRYPDSLQERYQCEQVETRAARKLFDLIEDVESGSPAFMASHECVEKWRLKKLEKTKLQKVSVNWSRALECVETYFAQAAAP